MSLYLNRATGLAWAVVLVHALALPALATNFVVTTTTDSGAGSLRAAIASANAAAGADDISFNLSGCPPCVISLATPLAITGALTITGPGAGTLALDGGNAVQVIQTADVPVGISDLTVRNGRSATNGGGIFAAGVLTLTRVTLRGNTTAHGGGGVYASRAVTVVDSVFDTNSATGATDGDGGGLNAVGQLTMTGSRFVNNTAPTMKGYSGGGGLIAFGPTTISTTVFIGNSTANWGGGAFIADFVSPRPMPTLPPATPSVLTDVQFMNNTAQSGGGGGLFVWFEAILNSVDASDNYSGYYGGGVYGGYSGNYPVALNGGQLLHNSGQAGGGLYSDGDVTIDGTQITSNTARNGNGGGAWTPRNAVVSNASIAFNVVTMGGNSGGIDTGGSLTLASSIVSDNQTMTGNGGGSGAGGDATVTGSHYIGNMANGDGGGLLAYGTARATGSTFISNTAGGLGGGIHCGGPAVTITGTQFLTNTAKGHGGAVSANGTAMSDAVFIGNQGDTGGAVRQLGDGTIVNTLFARNHAVSTMGEALALDGDVSIRHSTIATSPDQAAGSAISVDGGMLELLNSIVASHAQGIRQNAGSVSADYNLFHGNMIDTLGAGGSVTNDHPVFGDPRFVDPAHDDYHLGLGSAAIDAGPAIGVFTDIDGDARPQGGGFDLGYDEFNPAPSTTSSTSTTTTTTSTSTSTTSPCPADGFAGALCRLERLSPGDLCAPEPLPSALELYIASRVSKARDILEAAQLKALGNGKPAAVNRLIAAANRQLAAILKKVKAAGKRRGKKPPAISATCLGAIDQQIGGVRQRVLGLRH